MGNSTPTLACQPFLDADAITISAPHGLAAWGVDEDLLKRAVKVALLDDRVRAILKPERFEPDWVY